jgi:membrane protein DedA with SNARE-associated domain
MEEALTWLVDTIGVMGYPGIVILMAMESSIIPVPSELVMAPAGYLAHEGRMSLWMAIFCGTVGSLIGSYANYFVAQYLGRPLILKYGKYVGISAHKFEMVERYFEAHGEISVFVCRLLPVLRHLISIPAGLSRMSHARFATYTAVGAGLWMIVLTYIGYFIGREKEMIAEYSHQAVLYAIVFCVALIIGYVLVKRRQRVKQEADAPAE